MYSNNNQVDLMSNSALKIMNLLDQICLEQLGLQQDTIHPTLSKYMPNLFNNLKM